MSRPRAKWEDLPAGAIAAGVADMELAPLPAAVEAAAAAVSTSSGYPSTADVEEAVGAGVEWHDRRHRLALVPDRCVPVSSVAGAAAWALVRLSDPGDAVVRLRPTYPPLTDAVAVTEREDRPVDLVADGAGGWTIDLDALDAACRGARLLLWVSPHNPTGRVWTADEMAAVATIVARHGLEVIADEVWADVVLAADRPHQPFAREAAAVDPALAARTVTLVTTTKPFNLAGLAGGLLHVADDRRHELLRGAGHVPLQPVTSRARLAATAVAWRAGEAWLDDTVGHLRDVVGAAVTSLRAAYGPDRVTATEATYTVWLDLRGLAPDDDPIAALAVPGGVVATDGASYGAPGFVRLNAATSAAEVAAIVDRVVRFVPPDD